jgi:hypothetical protein
MMSVFGPLHSLIPWRFKLGFPAAEDSGDDTGTEYNPEARERQWIPSLAIQTGVGRDSAPRMSPKVRHDREEGEPAPW